MKTPGLKNPISEKKKNQRNVYILGEPTGGGGGVWMMFNFVAHFGKEMYVKIRRTKYKINQAFESWVGILHRRPSVSDLLVEFPWRAPYRGTFLNLSI